jgi:hypothetical protein
VLPVEVKTVGVIIPVLPVEDLFLLILPGRPILVNTFDPCGVGLFIPDLKYSKENRSFKEGTPEMFLSGQFAPSLFFHDNGFKQIKFCLQAFLPKKIARQAKNSISSQPACSIFASLFPAPASNRGIGRGDEKDQRD